MTFKLGNKFGCKPFKNSLRKRYSKERKGKKNPNWKGGKNKGNCLKCGKVVYGYKKIKYCSKLCYTKCPIWLKLISEVHTGKYGDKASNWQGGTFKQNNLRGLSKYYWWKNQIYKIKGKKCWECGTTKNLEVDHIKPLCIIIAENKINTVIEFIENKEIWNIKNGRVLCKKHHKIKQTPWKQLKKLKKDISSTQ